MTLRSARRLRLEREAAAAAAATAAAAAAATAAEASHTRVQPDGDRGGGGLMMACRPPTASNPAATVADAATTPEESEAGAAGSGGLALAAMHDGDGGEAQCGRMTQGAHRSPAAMHEVGEAEARSRIAPRAKCVAAAVSVVGAGEVQGDSVCRVVLLPL